MLERMLSRVPVRLRLPHISSPAARKPVVRLPLVLSIRTYATPGRPKSVVGEPSRPVKRAVKKAASTPKDGTSAAEKKTRVKWPRKVTPEEAAKRQEALDQKAARQAARTQRAAERKVAEKEKKKKQDLQVAALPDAPRKFAYTSAYLVFWSETAKGTTPGSASLASQIREASIKWKALAPGDIEHYNHLKRTANEAAAAKYKAWIESHSPDEIRLANLARSQLRRDNPKWRLKWQELHDERRPKRPQSAYLRFNMDRQSSGDFANIRVAERSKLIAQEWRALSESEKEKYAQLQKKDAARYHEEHSRVFGYEPRMKAAAADT